MAMKKIISTIVIACSFIAGYGQNEISTNQATSNTATNSTAVKAPAIIAAPALIQMQPKLVPVSNTASTGVQNINKTASIQQPVSNTTSNKNNTDEKELPVNANAVKLPELKSPDKPAQAAPLVKINN